MSNYSKPQWYDTITAQDFVQFCYIKPDSNRVWLYEYRKRYAEVLKLRMVMK